jgi:hypothetical protein
LSATALLAAASSGALYAQPPTPKGPLLEGFVSQPPDKTEIVSLIGGISSPNGKPYVHVHMVVGSADGTTKACHLLEAHIAPVGELTVVATSFAP